MNFHAITSCWPLSSQVVGYYEGPLRRIPSVRHGPEIIPRHVVL